ncbi:hexokinase [Apiospora arundinis]
MDPFTIFQVVGTAVSLTDVVVKSIGKLNSIRTRYYKCPLLISTMIGQLYIVQSALGRLSAMKELEHTQDLRYRDLDLQIGNSLDSFSTLILTLQKHLDRFEHTTAVDMGAKQKIKFLWNEKDMSEYSVLLDRQVNALNLLLQALECSSWTQQHAFVSQAENQEVLRIARDCSSSIVGLDDGSRSIVSERTELISIIFDFDTTILGSRVYQQAERSHLRQAIRGVRSEPTRLAPPSTHSDPSSDTSSNNNNDSESRPSPTSGPKKTSWGLRRTRLGQRWVKSTQVLKTDATDLVMFENPRTPPTPRQRPPKSRLQRVLTLGNSESGNSVSNDSITLGREGLSDESRASFTDIVWTDLVDGTKKILDSQHKIAADVSLVGDHTGDEPWPSTTAAVKPGDRPITDPTRIVTDPLVFAGANDWDLRLKRPSIADSDCSFAGDEQLGVAVTFEDSYIGLAMAPAEEQISDGNIGVARTHDDEHQGDEQNKDEHIDNEETDEEATEDEYTDGETSIESSDSHITSFSKDGLQSFLVTDLFQGGDRSTWI